MAGIDQIKHLIDPEFGIARFVMMHPKPLWFSDAVLATALCSNSSGAIALVLEEQRRERGAMRKTRVPGDTTLTGLGLGYSMEEALMKAVCEGVERFCARIVQPRLPLIYGSYDDLKQFHQIVAPSEWKILTSEQYESNRRWLETAGPAFQTLTMTELTHSTKISWAHALDVLTHERCLVPAQTVFMGYAPIMSPQDEAVVMEPMSTGLACGQTVEDAVLSGLLEVLERDAIMGMWINRLSPPRVDFAKSRINSPRLRRLLSELGRTGYEILVNDLTSDFGIPIYFSTLLHDQVPYTVVGAAAHYEPEIAIEKSLIELMMALAALAHTEHNGDPITDLADSPRMHDHARMYYLTDYRDRLAFLNSQATVQIRPAFSQGEDKATILRTLCESIQRLGYRVFYHDLTTPEAAAAGLVVARSIVPGLLPLNNLHRNSPSAASRVCQFREIFNREHTFPEEMNPWPHPFP